jgi:hypothetical protein
MKFIFEQRTRDYYEVEAETEDEAREIVYSGEVMVSNTKYEELNLIKTEGEAQ